MSGFARAAPPAARRRIAMAAPALLAAGLAAGCAAQGPAARAPFLTPAPAEVDALRRAPAPFRVLEEAWRWADTLPAASRHPLAGDPLAHGRLGLVPAQRYRLVSGECADCSPAEAALWYFRDDLVAVPRTAEERPAAPDGDPLAPLPAWIGAPAVLEHARLSGDARELAVGGSTIPLAITPRSPTNRAYLDASSARFFAARPLRVRGAALADGGRTSFVARMLWPQDWRIDARALGPRPLGNGEMLGTLIEGQMGGVADPLPTRLLFERGGRAGRWAGKAVLAIVLSGAQGDDDASRGGHLAVATGKLGPEGEWHDWLVTNFYPLEHVNAKGIVPASLPMDNYLLDFNSGQLYYRPGYMLVAVLARPRTAAAAQAALQRVLLSYYCREVDYATVSHNSTAMSIDALRGLGWRIPSAGATSHVAGVLAAPVAAVIRRSFTAGREVFNALTMDQARLLPRVAFEVLGHDLLYLAGAQPRPEGLTPFERMLAEDVDAVLFARLPQVPSSRPFGSYPARSLLAYGAELQANPGPLRIGQPLGERDLPEGLADSCRPRQSG